MIYHTWLPMPLLNLHPPGRVWYQHLCESKTSTFGRRDRIIELLGCFYPELHSYLNVDQCGLVGITMSSAARKLRSFSRLTKSAKAILASLMPRSILKINFSCLPMITNYYFRKLFESLIIGFFIRTQICIDLHRCFLFLTQTRLPCLCKSNDGQVKADTFRFRTQRRPS